MTEKTIKDIIELPEVKRLPIGLRLENTLTPVHYYYDSYWKKNYSTYLENKVVEYKIFNNGIKNYCLIIYK